MLRSETEDLRTPAAARAGNKDDMTIIFTILELISQFLLEYCYYDILRIIRAPESKSNYALPIW
jgi:hypothetical protein